ncbi:uncharacterized protein LOC112526392 [Cynara cardunculus var. scolymus]|uniref:uncharacterized protein LOC112526392 n=1 Tax=Cynara cardunculus var. scolymus TaxID=59895 RepID=UPI000D62ADBE|nr:uncharacterized protein LOC112526392 [Cynara cardunculus var. scolymus]
MALNRGVDTTDDWLLPSADCHLIEEPSADCHLLVVLESGNSVTDIKHVSEITTIRHENVSENPIENVSENPIENVPENPIENVPENPNENVFENPTKNVSENPNDFVENIENLCTNEVGDDENPCNDEVPLNIFDPRIFKTAWSRSQLATEGINDWRHLGETLSLHENSFEHMINLRTWTELRVRLNKNQTIDKELQELIKKDTDHWKEVLIRIIAVVKCLAQYNLAFRGSNEKIYQNSNGNFWSVIIKKIKEAKYFSVILDCTPDASHKEHMTLIIRCVDMSCAPVSVEEFFLEFLVVEDTSGLGLFTVLQDVLKSLDLDINCVRGQGYDNGSNMKGKHQGVQKRLFDVNPRAFYMPCGCHSLNLVLCDMANSCYKAKTFFGTCQTIYNVFANSTKRWNVLLEFIDDLTLKSLSTTRWESHIESVKAIKSQFAQIREALLKLSQVSDDGKLCRDAESLVNGELSSFEFIVSLVIWHEILYKINLVSKKLQSKDMLLDVAFDEIPNTEREQQSAQETFRTDYFLVLVDMALSQLKTRFEQMKIFESIFGFMFDGSRLVNLNDEELKNSCMNLEVALTNGDDCDIDGKYLFMELQILQEMLPSEAYKGEKPWTSIEILEFAKKMDMFPYVLLAYRILLTIPVMVASAERSFSKLKLLKSYLRSTMSQERLNGLAILSIESKFLTNVEYEKIIDIFVSRNARRHRFR